MKNLNIILISIIIAIAIIAGDYGRYQSKTIESNKLRVVGSFYPIAHFVKQVGGDNVTVTNITPAGAEPHDFEPTARDIVKVNQAQLFIYNGNDLDPWADKAKDDVISNGGAVLKISDSITSLQSSDQETPLDPHFWLDPILVQQEVNLIRDALVKVDPAHSADYQQNAQRYSDQLTKLDNQYKIGLADCQLRDIVTSHAAFGYLAKRYGLNQISITGISPEEEPAPQQLAEIAELAKQIGIKYIFFEELVSPKLSETIAKEIGAKTIAFNPLEGLTDKQIKEGKTYITEMKSNLANLKTALICQ